jgi:hypothetical protein
MRVSSPSAKLDPFALASKVEDEANHQFYRALRRAAAIRRAATKKAAKPSCWTLFEAHHIEESLRKLRGRINGLGRRKRSTNQLLRIFKDIWSQTQEFWPKPVPYNVRAMARRFGLDRKYAEDLVKILEDEAKVIARSKVRGKPSEIFVQIPPP